MKNEVNMVNLQTIKGKNYPLGVTVLKEGVQFALETDSEKAGVELIDKETNESYKIPFDVNEKTGKICSIIIKNLDIKRYDYRFYNNKNFFVDPYANKVLGNENFGVKDENYSLKGAFVSHDSYDWEDDKRPHVSYKDTIMYLLHVRGFTAHSSSKVKHKGTVQGIIQKIPYLKDLGVTSLELMPSYEFEEYVIPPKKLSKIAPFENPKKINYWGFKDGFYYAPKSSYCIGDAVTAFKDFVKEMHKAGLEVIMQFYFPNNVEAWKKIDVLRFWLVNYHIDGFHLKGDNIPIHVILSDPIFADTKIFYDYIPENEVFKYDEVVKEKFLYNYSDSYMYNMRKVLKGDEDILKDLVYYTRFVPEKSATVNFFTNYYGFTLNDLVSFDRKHNEPNGENNRDGADFNNSWNCGVEGKTRKPQIMSLRKRMIKNAIFLLMFSKGTPLITAGDEFMRTQNGNNNPYCIDDETTYVNWNLNSSNKEIYEFTKEMIKLRKDSLNGILQREFSMLDRQKIGYPDMSYHQEEAWKAELYSYNRHLGIMYSDFDSSNDEITLTYVAYNFYWKDIEFSLPFVPDNHRWQEILSTGNCIKKESEDKNVDKFLIEKRSVALFTVKFLKNNKK